MELLFLAVLFILMVAALGSGFPVAFSLPGSAILTIGLAALCGWLFAGDMDAYFTQGGPVQWLSAGVTNFRSLYWDVERDTLIAIPLFVFMGIMLQRSRIAEDLLVTMAQLFGPIPGGLGISVVFVGALLAATTGIVGATVIAMGLISLPAMLRHKYSHTLATGTVCASGTLGQIIPPSIVISISPLCWIILECICTITCRPILIGVGPTVTICIWTTISINSRGAIHCGATIPLPTPEIVAKSIAICIPPL